MVAGEDLRDVAHRQAHQQAHDHGQEDPDLVVDPLCITKQHEDEAEHPEHRDDGRAVGASMQRCCQVGSGRANEERPDDRGSHADRRHRQRKHHRLLDESPPSEDDGREGDRGHQRSDIRLEEVGTHAGDVAHVVAHVVGDHRRITRIVLGDPGFDLANQVGADVGSLGVDPPSDTGEEGDRRSAQADCRDDVEGVVHLQPLHEQQVRQPHAEEAEAGHRESHHGTATEGQRQRLLDPALAGGLRGAGICSRGHPHADEAGECREHGAEDVGDGAPGAAPVQQHEDQNRHGHHEDNDPGVFTAQECHRTLTDRGRDLLHPVIALGCCQHLACAERGQQ